MRLPSSVPVVALAGIFCLSTTTTHAFFSLGGKPVSRSPMPSFGERAVASTPTTTTTRRVPKPLYSTTAEPEVAKPGETFQFQAEVSR